MPAQFFLEIVAGEDLLRTLTWTDANNNLVNVTGYHAQLIVNNQADGTILLDITDAGVQPDSTDPITAGDSVTVGGSNGQFTFKITAASLGTTNRLMDYRFLVTPPGGGPRCLLFGQIALQGLN